MSHCHHINPYILIAGQEALAEADYWQRPPDGFSRARPLFPVNNCIGQPRLWRNSCCFQMLLLLWNWKCGANAAGAKRINPSSCVRTVLQKMFYMPLVMVKITVKTMSLAQVNSEEKTKDSAAWMNDNNLTIFANKFLGAELLHQKQVLPLGWTVKTWAQLVLERTWR